MPGLGTVAVGSTPFGVGTPVTAAAPPTGTGVGVRFLNPANRDYEQDPTTKHLAQMPTVRQRVLLALMTIRGSSTTLPRFGVRMPRKLGDTWAADTRNSVRDALRRLVEVEKVVRLDAIHVAKFTGGRVHVTVEYADLTTGETGQQIQAIV